ncbi:cytochrome P450 [Sphingomonas bacterium]|uniref:cytochrome P450 n=1 Tax=Sphingomonas bacterium TaxID=1895847 RepID=UPI001576E062|nr:cytochrome P450 [Sphingomonas bacterium]
MIDTLTPLELDPYGKEFVTDPYPLYRRLRDEAPVYRSATMPFWALTRYDDVYASLRDDQAFISGQGVTIEGTEKGMPYLIIKDAPQHSWHKGLAVKIFTRGRMARLEEFIRVRAIELIEELGQRESYDWAEDFAAKLPMDVIAELTDIPEEYRDEIHRWTDIFTLRGDDADPELIKESHRRRLEIFRELIKDRKRSPKDDVITLLMTSETPDADGNPYRMTEEDIVYHYSELGNAGHETVARALPNCLLALHAFPDQRARLAADLGLAESAADELLRYDNPAQYLGRTTSRDLTLHDVTIPAGERVLMFIASAVNDERRFEHPRTLDITRPIDPRSIHFGAGIHKCLGIHLARTEIRVVLEELFARFPDYTVEPASVTRAATSNLRGVRSLTIRPGRHA